MILPAGSVTVDSNELVIARTTDVFTIRHRVPQKKPFKIGELVNCRCPEGVCKLPLGLPKNAVVEVVATSIDTTHVQYYRKTFVVPTHCVHRQSDAG